MARTKDPETGKFMTEEEAKEKLKNVDVQNDYAIFASAGKDTSNFSGLIMTMQAAEYRTSNRDGTKGKRIEFNDGRYKTKNKEEIEFLLWKCDNPIKYSKIKCIQLPDWYKKIKESA